MSTTPISEEQIVRRNRRDAFFSYIIVIGVFIAIRWFVKSKKTKLVAFHLRQALGLFITGVAFGFCAFVLTFIPFIGLVVIMVGSLALSVLVIMGLIAAATGQQKPVPVLGAKYQQWFAGAFV